LALDSRKQERALRKQRPSCFTARLLSAGFLLSIGCASASSAQESRAYVGGALTAASMRDNSVPGLSVAVSRPLNARFAIGVEIEQPVVDVRFTDAYAEFALRTREKAGRPKSPGRLAQSPKPKA
jgi:hypothetical protein